MPKAASQARVLARGFSDGDTQAPGQRRGDGGDGAKTGVIRIAASAARNAQPAASSQQHRTERAACRAVGGGVLLPGDGSCSTSCEARRTRA